MEKHMRRACSEKNVGCLKHGAKGCSTLEKVPFCPERGVGWDPWPCDGATIVQGHRAWIHSYWAHNRWDVSIPMR